MQLRAAREDIALLERRIATEALATVLEVPRLRSLPVKD